MWAYQIMYEWEISLNGFLLTRSIYSFTERYLRVICLWVPGIFLIRQRNPDAELPACKNWEFGRQWSLATIARPNLCLQCILLCVCNKNEVICIQTYTWRGRRRLLVTGWKASLIDCAQLLVRKRKSDRLVPVVLYHL